MPYIGNDLDVILREHNYAYRYVATAGQTIFTGPDSFTNSLVCSNSTTLEVFLNGLRLVRNADFTVGQNSVTLLVAASVDDEVAIVTEVESSSFNHYTKNETYTKAETDVKIVELSPPTDLSDYSTTTEMNNAISGAVDGLVDSAPGTLDTLNELAAALGDDANFASTVTNTLNTKADKSNVLEKNNTTAYSPTSNYHPATKAYVDALASSGGGNVSITQGFTFTGDGTTTTFDCGADDSYILGAIDVYHNGLQLDGSDYTAADGRNITLTSLTPASGDIVKLVAYGGADVYNKTQTDTLLAAKANTGDVYTQSQTDTLLANKANTGDVYTQAQTDTLLAAKADLGNALANGITYSASDPTSTDNVSSVGHIWVNTTSGEVYVCTDNTSNDVIWVNVGEGSGNINYPEYPAALGGNSVTTVGDYKIHTFTSSGTFNETAVGNAAGSNTIDYIIVGGGAGGGGADNGYGAGGGGGGGGAVIGSYTANGTTRTVTIGAGGSGRADGNSSSVTGLTTVLGGGRASHGSGDVGSLATGGGGYGRGFAGGSGTTGQGYAGGAGAPSYGGGGGGGGAGSAGAAGSGNYGGNGGIGKRITWSGSEVGYGGGGGGGEHATDAAPGVGVDGGGTGGYADNSTVAYGNDGLANRGGGGSGGGMYGGGTPETSGGSGVVIFRYKFQN